MGKAGTDAVAPSYINMDVQDIQDNLSTVPILLILDIHVIHLVQDVPQNEGAKVWSPSRFKPG